MKYEEIIRLNDNFQPVFDLQNEIGTYWKQFIPNNKFYNVLSSVINSLSSNKPEDRQPIWLQGTYGTGKSHATSVIKHLLADDLSIIKDFEIENTQLNFKFDNFRRKNRVFPVVIKATSTVFDNRTFALTIEKAVKESLKNEGILKEMNVKTDFDEMILKLRGDELNWDILFKGTELELYGSKEDVISKLEREDQTILITIEEILSNKGIHFNKEDISSWLEEIVIKLKEKNIADYLMIYWDEFTGIFELPKSSLILTEIQNIAELSFNKDIFLFIVSHRTPHQTDLSDSDIEKILGRFKVLDYSMETITTYHIMNATIQKINKDKWKNTKNNHIDSIKLLIDIITGSEGIKVQKTIENLFPIHPYTAYLATFIARNIGSTERSVFKFLYDDNTGFKKFIKENPENDGGIFLSSDSLWDFFYEDFERSGNEKVISVLERFKLYKNTLEKLGSSYLTVFKGILLLNILYKVMEVNESSLVNPSEENIKNLFMGCLIEKDLNEILKSIDEKQIINKTPDDLYILTSSGLPQNEIENEKEKLESNYKNIDAILTSDQKNKIKNFISDSVIRKTEIVLMDTNLNEHLINKRLEKAFNDKYSLHLCLFLGKNRQELGKIKNIIEKISKYDSLNNIIFMVSEVILEKKDMNLFLSYKARAIVADKHNYSDDRVTNESYANKIIDKWIENIKSGYVNWYLFDKTANELIGQFSKTINELLSKQVFSLGLENIEGVIKKNIWTSSYSKRAVEIFLFANNREYIEKETTKAPYNSLKMVLKDNNNEFIIDSNLEFKHDIHDEHPINTMHLKIAKTLENQRNGNFNLGITLNFLAEPPYGLYANMVNLSAFSFIIREYSGKFFAAGTGIPIQKENMRDLVLNLFRFWETGRGSEKLNVRFGSHDEEMLINCLNLLFKFDNVRSLNDTRWQIRDWVKKIGYPIWIFKFSRNINLNAENAIDTIFKIIKSVDEELTDKKISEYLDKIELAKYDLDLILNQKNYREFFVKWINDIKSIDLAPSDYDELILYIKKNMQEEVGSWTENKTREVLKDWEIDQNL
ncbi:MAG: hypothetical protein Q8N97_02095 [Methanobacteriaceae archaeon]|nr:hypothetical protein [Methanobacteriaceae archaeon]